MMQRYSSVLDAAERHEFLPFVRRLADESGGRASYELEFPDGGIAYVIGNIIEQSATSENPRIISFGAEGYTRPTNELYLINNTLIDNRPESGIFLTVSPGASVVTAYNNLLLGKRLLNTGINGIFVNNPNIDAGTEDATLKEKLYATIMRGFLDRIERQKDRGTRACASLISGSR